MSDNPLELTRLFFIGNTIVLSLHGMCQVNPENILIERSLSTRCLLHAQHSLFTLFALQAKMELDHLGVHRGLRRILNHLHGGIHKDRRAGCARACIVCSCIAFKIGYPSTGDVFAEDLVSGRSPCTFSSLPSFPFSSIK